jgi:hypothetical protein
MLLSEGRNAVIEKFKVLDNFAVRGRSVNLNMRQMLDGNLYGAVWDRCYRKGNGVKDGSDVGV